jgi:hypothetical protein
MRNSKSMLGIMSMMAMMSGEDFPMDYSPIKKPKTKKPLEEKPQNGQFHYWFRSDGTFLSEKQGERMLKEDCVFKCFAINDKNAIKKFNKFIKP